MKRLDGPARWTWPLDQSGQVVRSGYRSRLSPCLSRNDAWISRLKLCNSAACLPSCVASSWFFHQVFINRTTVATSSYTALPRHSTHSYPQDEVFWYPCLDACVNVRFTPLCAHLRDTKVHTYFWVWKCTFPAELHSGSHEAIHIILNYDCPHEFDFSRLFTIPCTYCSPSENACPFSMFVKSGYFNALFSNSIHHVFSLRCM